MALQRLPPERSLENQTPLKRLNLYRQSLILDRFLVTDGKKDGGILA
jgi:hypothetical protein